MSERGGVKLSVVVAAAFAVGFAASAYLNFMQHEHAEQARLALQGEITDLRFQASQDRLPASTSPSPSPTSSASPSPSAEPSTGPSVAGTANITIGIYGVKLTAIDPLTDLTYGQVASGGFTAAGFTTESLLAKYPGCKPGSSALGTLTRRTKSQKPTAQEKFIKVVGDYTYYYIKPTSFCATDQAGKDSLAAARVTLSNTVLPTISN